MFRNLYYLVLLTAHIVSTPFILIFSLNRKYRHSLPARFFLWKNPPFSAGGIWIHVCSFGEAQAIKTLVERFDAASIRISTTTETGRTAIGKIAPEESRYLPFETLLPLWIRPQKALVVLEAELWYLLFALMRRKGAETFLLNARISERSFSKYRRFSWLYRRIFSEIEHIYAQTDGDRKRLEDLGARNVKVTGNIKFSGIGTPSRKLRKPEGILVCAGSTHEKEEGIILNAFRSLKAIKHDSKIVLVPRHPERFAKVEKMAKSFAYLQKWSFARFSETDSFEADVTLVDKMGELINCYAVSDVVVLGGAFEPIGGHNAAEAAQFGCKIISGPHYFNQKELFAGIEGIEICDSKMLPEVLKYPALLPNTRIIARKDPLEDITRELKRVLQDS